MVLYILLGQVVLLFSSPVTYDPRGNVTSRRLRGGTTIAYELR